MIECMYVSVTIVRICIYVYDYLDSCMCLWMNGGVCIDMILCVCMKIVWTVYLYTCLNAWFYGWIRMRMNGWMCMNVRLWIYECAWTIVCMCTYVQLNVCLWFFAFMFLSLYQYVYELIWGFSNCIKRPQLSCKKCLWMPQFWVNLMLLILTLLHPLRAIFLRVSFPH